MSRRARAVVEPPSPSLRANDLLFLNEYFRNGQNGTQAYRSVHPNAKYGTAEVSAYRLLRKPQVVAEVARRTRYDVGITKEWGSTRLLEYEAMALDRHDYVAGAAIVMDAMKLGGFITDKREITTVSDGDSQAIKSLVQRALRQPASLSPSVNHEDGTAPHTPPQYPSATSVPSLSTPSESSTVAPTLSETSEPTRPCDAPPVDDAPRPEDG